MCVKHSIKKSIIIGAFLLTVTGLMFPSTTAYIVTDVSDGIWTDDFKCDSIENASVNCTNCRLDFKNGTVLLNRSVDGRPYSIDGSSHRAFSYTAFRFFPMPPLFSLFEHLSDFPF